MNLYGVFILGVNIKYGLSFVSLGSKVAYTSERVKALHDGMSIYYISPVAWYS